MAASPETGSEKHPVDCEGGWIPCWLCMGDGDYHDYSRERDVVC